MMKKRMLIIGLFWLLVMLTACHSEKDQQTNVNSTQPKTYAHFDKNADRSILSKPYRVRDESGNVSYDYDLMRQQQEVLGYYIAIEDFDIETDETIPIKHSEVSNTEFYALIVDIDGTLKINDNSFRLRDLIYYDEWLDFRRIKWDDETCYYCVFENTDSGKKAVLIFKPDYSTWACSEYMVLDSDGTPVERRDSDSSFQTDRPEELIKLIASVDLQ